MEYAVTDRQAAISRMCESIMRPGSMLDWLSWRAIRFAPHRTFPMHTAT